MGSRSRRGKIVVKEASARTRYISLLFDYTAAHATNKQWHGMSLPGLRTGTDSPSTSTRFILDPRLPPLGSRTKRNQEENSEE